MRAVLLLLAIAACGDDLAPHRIDPDAIVIDGRAFRDTQGRQRLWRGYNAKVQDVFDVSFSDGRAPNYTFPPFTDEVAAQLEDMGLDVIRLPVSWSALEPAPREYAASFFDALDDAIALARAHGMHVIIDMHQDAYSKEIGEDGAPLWAITPTPSMVLAGPSDDSRRLSAPVLAAGLSFFKNLPASDGRPLQEAFTDAVAQIVSRHVGDPTVIGYEAFNEPVVFDTTQLDKFHERVANRVHAIDPDAALFFEPWALRNQSDTAPLADAPWSHGPGVYAPHIYTGQFTMPTQNGWESEDPAVLAPSMASAEMEAASWGTPLFATEFGCDQTLTRGPKWLSAELDLQDQYLTSSTAWAREWGSWGLYSSSGTLWPETARVMSRSYPRAVAGDLLAIERPEPGHLRVRYRPSARTVGLPHEVSASSLWFTDVHVLCDGAPADFTQLRGRIEFDCGATGTDEHTFEVIGTPVPATQN
ncbi:MAG TPA: cellulase family glycosylhydrolase [Kofleriaceae bacterium]|nr:cellulase family glycosylhydrolase [Kofleriaceae bacterium]